VSGEGNGIDRRTFLGLAGAAALSRKPGWLDDLLPVRVTKLGRIGIQLYTVRGAMQKDGVDVTLAKLAKLGFQEVEFAGYYNRSAAQIKDALTANGLTSPSTHVQLSQLTDANFQKLVDDSVTIGHKWINVAFLMPNDRGSADKYKSHADAMLAAQEIAKKSGITIGYHNHDFEFEKLGDTDGYEILLDRTKGSGIQFEMDLYWITKGGQDPLRYFAKWPGRFPLVHIKDMDATPRHYFTEVGKGTVDFKRIFQKAGPAGIRHYFYEQDEVPGSPFDSAKASYDYLRALRY
jgi:sugar phosphate isomerase/epimerase